MTKGKFFLFVATLIVTVAIITLSMIQPKQGTRQVLPGNTMVSSTELPSPVGSTHR